VGSSRETTALLTKWTGSRADALSGVGGADLGKARMSRQNKSVPFSLYVLFPLRVPFSLCCPLFPLGVATPAPPENGGLTPILFRL
jgi:hypothetical protein